EVLDVDHAEFARTCAIDIPGPETDRLGRLARSWDVFIMAQAKARHEDWPDRFFNRSEEHTSELQSLTNLVCRLLLERKKPLNVESRPKLTKVSAVERGSRRSFGSSPVKSNSKSITPRSVYSKENYQSLPASSTTTSF